VADELQVERRGRVLVVTIDRQERMNALSPAVHEGLEATWESLRGDRSVRAIVITGAGDRAFCSGMDLKAVAESGRPRPVKDDVHEQMRLTPLHCDVWLPTIVAVNGVCTGSGLHFVADADVVVASSTATFLDTHVSVGQVTAIEPVTLLPRIGLGNALRLAVLGRHGRIDAAEALRISLVDEVVEPARLLERAVELAEQAGSGSPAAVEASKRAIRGALERPMADAMQHGWELLLAQRTHPDSVEGPMAFSEKREPRWQ
jgi:enoyl-CoA hydratase/carnithine racemase